MYGGSRAWRVERGARCEVRVTRCEVWEPWRYFPGRRTNFSLVEFSHSSTTWRLWLHLFRTVCWRRRDNVSRNYLPHFSLSSPKQPPYHPPTQGMGNSRRDEELSPGNWQDLDKKINIVQVRVAWHPQLLGYVLGLMGEEGDREEEYREVSG